MNNQMTSKQIAAYFDKRIYVPYCAMQRTLKFFREVGYNSGVYGWNYSVYHVAPWTCIITGYRTRGTNCTISGTTCKEIESYTENLIQSNMPYEDIKRALYAKMNEICEGIIID